MAFGKRRSDSFSSDVASVYDSVHGRGVDYAARAEFIARAVYDEDRSQRKRLLDVACGTGRLAAALTADFDVEGLDSSKEMLRTAAAALPGIPLHLADMSRFRAPRKYDVITCLGASLCYSESVAKLRATIASIAKHLKRGGIVIADCWLQPDQYTALEEQGIWRIDIEEPARKISVFRRVERSGRSVTLDYHYMVGAASGISYFRSQHHVTMFTMEENHAAFRSNGLEPALIPDPEALFRGAWMYRGVKADR